MEPGRTQLDSIGVMDVSGEDDEDRAEFTDFVAARWTTLQRAAMLWGCAPDEAEDAVQETLINCFVYWKKVTRAHNVDAYVARILINCMNRGVRKRRRWADARPALDDRRFGVELDATRLEVDDALRRLPSDQRTAVVLHYFLDLPVAEVADITRTPIGTIKSRLARARDQLSTSLQPLQTTRNIDDDD